MHDKQYTAWYEKVYPELSGYGIWLRGNEINTMDTGLFDTSLFRMLFVRLSTYRDTSQSFTHKVLYAIAGRIDSVYADIAYLPPPDDCRIFDRDSIPWILPVTSKADPLDFHCIGLSNSTVLELINLPVMLKKSNIPLKKNERLSDEHIPLVILGGANATASTLLWTDDPLVDGIFIGDDIQCINTILTICRDGKKKESSKLEILKELESVPGFFQPDSVVTIKRCYSTDPSPRYYPTNQPVLYESSQIGKGNIQISYGCPFTCTFCFESWANKPYREVPVETVVDNALQMKALCGLETIELTSFNFNIHSGIHAIIERLNTCFNSIGLKSQRIDILGKQPELLAMVNKTSITVGLEGISKRIRGYLNKKLHEESLVSAFSQIFNNPVRELKIFLICTGLEDKDDFTEFQDFLADISHMKHAGNSSARIILSCTPLVRFPLTPLEFENGDTIEHYRSVINTIAHITRKCGFEFRQSYSLNEYWVAQVIARACDKRIADALMAAVEQTDFVYYNGMPEFFFNSFKNRLSAIGLHEDDLFNGFHPDSRRILPWTKIETSIARERLIEQHDAARQYITGRQNGKTAKSAPDEYSNPALIRTPRNQTAMLSKKTAEKTTPFFVTIKEKARGIDRKIAGIAMGRAIMMSMRDYIQPYRGYRGSLICKNHSAWVTGDDIISLAWNENVVKGLADSLNNPGIIRSINDITGNWLEFRGIAGEKSYQPIFTIVSPFPFSEQGFMEYSHLKFTRIKLQEHRYRFDFSRQSLKKNLIKELVLQTNAENTCTITLVPGEKFSIVPFLQKSFRTSHFYDWVRIAAYCELTETPDGDKRK